MLTYEIWMTKNMLSKFKKVKNSIHIYLFLINNKETAPSINFLLDIIIFPALKFFIPVFNLAILNKFCSSENFCDVKNQIIELI